VDLYSTLSWHTCKALKYGTGTRSQGFSQFYLHTLHSSANGINYTCLCLPSQSWYSFTDPGGMEDRVGLGVIWMLISSFPEVSICRAAGWLTSYQGRDVISCGICCSGHESIVHTFSVCRMGFSTPERPLRFKFQPRYEPPFADIPIKYHAGMSCSFVLFRAILCSAVFCRNKTYQLYVTFRVPCILGSV